MTSQRPRFLPSTRDCDQTTDTFCLLNHSAFCECDRIDWSRIMLRPVSYDSLHLLRLSSPYQSSRRRRYVPGSIFLFRHFFSVSAKGLRSCLADFNNTPREQRSGYACMFSATCAQRFWNTPRDGRSGYLRFGNMRTAL